MLNTFKYVSIGIGPIAPLECPIVYSEWSNSSKILLVLVDIVYDFYSQM
jgi:hypothetical protein